MPELFVFIHLPREEDAVPAGRLTVIPTREGEANTFAYGRRYVTRPNAIPVDPVSLPLAAVNGEQWPVNGLQQFGALRDATPDAWGRRVIENRRKVPPNSLPESTYLLEAGPHRSGALDVRTALDADASPGQLPAAVDLAYLVEAAGRIEEGEDVPARLAAYFEGGPTLGGARPKAALYDAGVQWVAKFPSLTDRWNVPRIEFATLRLAQEAGLNVPETRIVTIADGRDVMLIQRFDRIITVDGTFRRHMVSALTMLGLQEHESRDASYAQIAQAISIRGADGFIEEDRRELFGRMVFNIMVSNDDDHLRNHAFLYDDQRKGWRLSPLYDVVPTPQIGTERSLHLGVGKQGRASRLDNALSAAGQFGLLPKDAAEIIDRIVQATRPWRTSFEHSGVTDRECTTIQSAFRRADDVGMREVEKALRKSESEQPG